MFSISNVSLQIKNGKQLVSNEVSLLESEIKLKPGETLSLRSFIRVSNWPETEITIPCTISGKNAHSEIKYEGQESVGIHFSVSTIGTDPVEVKRMHEYCYAFFVPHYKMVYGKPVLFTENRFSKWLVSFLNKVLPTQPIQIVLNEIPTKRMKAPDVASEPKFLGVLVIHQDVPADWDSGIHRFAAFGWEDADGKILLSGGYISSNNPDQSYSVTKASPYPDPGNIKTMKFLKAHAHKPARPSDLIEWSLEDYIKKGYIEVSWEDDQSINDEDRNEYRHVDHYTWKYKVA